MSTELPSTRAPIQAFPKLQEGYDVIDLADVAGWEIVALASASAYFRSQTMSPRGGA